MRLHDAVAGGALTAAALHRRRLGALDACTQGEPRSDDVTLRTLRWAG